VSTTETAPANVRRATLEDERDYLKMLYQGEPGSGKTTAAAHMAKLGRVVWVSAEPGIKAGPLRKLGVPLENIELHREITYDALNTLCAELRETLDADPDAYVGVVFDTFSELQGKLLEAKAKGLLISQQEYGVNTQEMTLLLRHFTDLPCHVVYTAHTKRDEDDDKAVVYRPSVTPKVSGTLMGYVDVACYTLEVAQAGGEDSDYLGLFRSAGKYRAKDRFGVLPPRLINPTFDRIAAYVDGGFRREAQKEADTGDAVPDGLDMEQYAYRQRVAAARKQQTAQKEQAA
jgi:adenylate kinase family enzyme